MLNCVSVNGMAVLSLKELRDIKTRASTFSLSEDDVARLIEHEEELRNALDNILQARAGFSRYGTTLRVVFRKLGGEPQRLIHDAAGAVLDIKAKAKKRDGEAKPRSKTRETIGK